MRYRMRRLCAPVGVLLAGAAACDFIEPTSSNPNVVPAATVDQLFVASQVNLWFFNEGSISRYLSIWMQQMAGTDRQFTSIGDYVITETDNEDEWFRIYGSANTRTGGGLVDLRRAQEQAQATGRRVYVGILKVHEAYLIGMAASLWGAIPYSEAVNPDITEPALDGQRDVYDAVLSLLDEAIADLQSGEGAGPGVNDFLFDGDAASWEAVAWSLKARFDLHWAEVDGNSRYVAARDAALNGISSAAGTWRSVHGTAVVESNLWFQFNTDRGDNISAGWTLVDMLDANLSRGFDAGDDPRLPVFYTTGSGAFAGQYIGAIQGGGPGDPGTNASELNPQSGRPGGATYGQPIVSCAETQLIIAEAENALGNDAAARGGLQAARDCEVAHWTALGAAITLPAVDPALTGAALRNAILEEKYKALFLNPEVFNDYKRACMPWIVPVGGSAIPGRFYYPRAERETNRNIPAPGATPGFNENDPNRC